jgi:FkbM family methyltransferase
MRLARRAVGALSRRLDRPQLLAAFYADAQQEQAEAVGISAALVAALGADGTYVDVGTNRGQLLREAVRIAPRGRHLAFEPIPELAQELKRAFPQVDCRALALGSSRELTQFCHFRTLDGWSGLRRSPQVSDEEGTPEYITVQVSTLDEELQDLNPRVVKIDVEGAELSVLEGGRSVLSQSRPLVIFEHVLGAAALYDAAPEAAWDLLNDLDYEIFSATGGGPFARAEFARNSSVVNWLARPLERVVDTRGA